MRLWASSDGTVWKELPAPSIALPEEQTGDEANHVVLARHADPWLVIEGYAAEVLAVTRDGTTWFVSQAGSTGEYAGSGPALVAAQGGVLVSVRAGKALTSADGVTWSRSRIPARCGVASSVAAGADGMLAVGDINPVPVGEPGDTGSTLVTQVVCTSRDATRWTVLDTLGPLPATPPRNGECRPCVDGSYMGDGTRIVAYLSGRAVWTSADGRSWTRARTGAQDGPAVAPRHPDLVIQLSDGLLVRDGGTAWLAVAESP